ncbi:MAG: glycosyltransferase [Bacteroidota bacterium]|nr:glycosyltransferase [Bacteroidota bacterium]
MKKIIIIGSAWPLRGGGLSTFNERLAKALLDAGNEVIIYTFSLQYPSFLFPGKSQYSEEEAPKELNIQVRINSINPLNWLRVGKEIKKLNPDYIIIRYWIPFMAPCLGSIARIAKSSYTKVIAITDNVIPHEKKPGDSLLSRYFIKSVDGFITMSRSVLSDLEKFDKKKPKSFCLHPLYDSYGDIIHKVEAKQQLNLDKETAYILFFGFIREYKGLDLLLEAFTDKRLRQKNVKLLIAGEFYTNPDPYLKIIEESGIKNDVLLHTFFIPNEKVAAYFCASDIIVQPYKDATQSGVTQTAYHFNKPMLVTDVGGLAETVPHGKVGYVVKPDAKQIADSLNDFFENNKEELFMQGAMKEKKKFSWEQFVDCIETLYAKLLEK